MFVIVLQSDGFSPTAKITSTLRIEVQERHHNREKSPLHSSLVSLAIAHHSQMPTTGMSDRPATTGTGVRLFATRGTGVSSLSSSCTEVPLGEQLSAVVVDNSNDGKYERRPVTAAVTSWASQQQTLHRQRQSPLLLSRPSSSSSALSQQVNQMILSRPGISTACGFSVGGAGDKPPNPKLQASRSSAALKRTGELPKMRELQKKAGSFNRNNNSSSIDDANAVVNDDPHIAATDGDDADAPRSSSESLDRCRSKLVHALRVAQDAAEALLCQKGHNTNHNTQPAAAGGGGPSSHAFASSSSVPNSPNRNPALAAVGGQRLHELIVNSRHIEALAAAAAQKAAAASAAALHNPSSDIAVSGILESSQQRLHYTDHMNEDARAEADEAMQLLLGSKFTLMSPSSTTATTMAIFQRHVQQQNGTQQPLSNLQFSALLNKVADEVALKSSAERKTRRNCLLQTVEVLRQAPAIRDHFTEHVKALQNEQLRYSNESIDGSSSPSSARSPTSMSQRTFSPAQQRRIESRNRTFAADPKVWKENTHQSRATSAKRGELARYLKDEMEKQLSASLEAALDDPKPRGAERSRDRRWASIVVAVSTAARCWTEALHRALVEASSSSNNVMDASLTSSASVSSYHRLKHQQPQVLPTNAATGGGGGGVDSQIEKKPTAVSSLMDDEASCQLIASLSRTCFAPRVIFKRRIMRQIACTRRVRLVLQAAASSLHTRRQVHRLLTCVRKIQRTFLKFHTSRITREGLIPLQFDAFCAERLFYGRPVCQEARQLVRKHASTTSSSALPSAVATTTAATSSTIAPVSSPVKGKTTATSKRALYPSSSMLASSLSQLPAPVAPPSQDLLIARTVAAPFVAQLVHPYGRFGGDPAAARLVALETHSLYAASGARITPKMRDKLIRLIIQREEDRFRERRRQWVVSMTEARQEHAWLVELRDVQKHMRQSPAAQQLATFVWPQYPLHRCLLSPNEMRLVVWLGFALMAEEKANGTNNNTNNNTTAPTTTTTGGGVGSTTTMTSAAVSEGDDSSPAASNPTTATASNMTSPVGVAAVAMIGAEEERHMVGKMQTLQNQLQLPNVSPEFLR